MIDCKYEARHLSEVREWQENNRGFQERHEIPDLDNSKTQAPGSLVLSMDFNETMPETLGLLVIQT